MEPEFHPAAHGFKEQSSVDFRLINRMAAIQQRADPCGQELGAEPGVFPVAGFMSFAINSLKTGSSYSSFSLRPLDWHL